MFFLNANYGKRCGGPHVARGPLIDHPWCKVHDKAPGSIRKVRLGTH